MAVDTITLSVVMMLPLLTLGGINAKEADIPIYAPESASIVINAETGVVVDADNQHVPCYPASLTKMMVLYLLFEAIEQREISLTHVLPVSQHASNQTSCVLDLKPGESISVQDAMLALAVKSANDVAVVVAEGLAENEAAFADKMTRKARELGMVNTVFKNASGWHDENQKTTAHDMAILLKEIIQTYPQYYHKYLGKKTFTFRGQKYDNSNKLLGKYPGMDGGKTGFTSPSGYNLAASAVRSGHRLIAVVLGGATDHARNNHMAQLLDKSFKQVAQGGLGKE